MAWKGVAAQPKTPNVTRHLSLIIIVGDIYRKAKIENCASQVVHYYATNFDEISFFEIHNNFILSSDKCNQNVMTYVTFLF
jgi:hypothetical protein